MLEKEKEEIKYESIEEELGDIPNINEKCLDKAANWAKHSDDLPMCFERAAMYAYYYSSLKKYNGVDRLDH